MKYNEMKNTLTTVQAYRRELREERAMLDAQRKRMLSVNPNARLATVFGATFVM